MTMRGSTKLLAAILCGLGSATVGAQTPAPATTVDFTDAGLAGKPSGVTVMNAPCVFGDTFHYRIDDRGALTLQGKDICGSLTGVAGQELCRLDSQLRCTSKAGTAYTVGESGVAAGDAPPRAWKDPQLAAMLFPAIRKRAGKRCDTVFAWQAIEKQHGKSPSPARAAEEAECKPVLDQLCAIAKGGPVTLASGRDITALCH